MKLLDRTPQRVSALRYYYKHRSRTDLERARQLAKYHRRFARFKAQGFNSRGQPRTNKKRYHAWLTFRESLNIVIHDNLSSTGQQGRAAENFKLQTSNH